MSKQRMIDTKFWDDNYTSNLDPIEKLLFLYCLSNTHTNICGIYEIPLKSIASDTWIDKNMVLKILDRFERDRKILFRDWWLVIFNFIKYQNQWSPKIQQWIENNLRKVPKWLTELMQIPYQYPIQAVSHSNSNLNSNLNLIISKDITEKISDTEKIEYWNKEINLTLEFLRKTVWVTDFKESVALQRRYAKHIFNLKEKIGKEDLKIRLQEILSDSFKSKNCNKLEYLYWELKSYIHSPIIPVSWKLNNILKV